jgi:hypothetical protein
VYWLSPSLRLRRKTARSTPAKTSSSTSTVYQSKTKRAIKMMVATATGIGLMNGLGL